MKIKDYKEIKRKTARTRRIKKETDLITKERDYYLEQIGDKIWVYHWFKGE